MRTINRTAHLTLNLILLVACLAGDTFAQNQADVMTSRVDEANRLNAAATKLYSEKRYKEALVVAKQALDLERQLSSQGTEKARLAVALNNLAEVLIAEKNGGEGEKLLGEALGIYEAEGIAYSERIGAIAQRIAVLRYLRKDYLASAAMLERSLAVREKTLGGDAKLVGETLIELARAYIAGGKYEEAESFYLRGLAIREKTLGPSNAETITEMKYFGCARLVYNRNHWTRGEDPPRIPVHLRPVSGRAFCWLYGFEKNCAESEERKIVTDERTLDSSDRVVNGRALRLPKPEYPKQARAVRATGTIIVAVLIDEAGDVVDARGICVGEKLLERTSLEAARLSKFSLTLINGKPYRVTGLITYHFASL